MNVAETSGPEELSEQKLRAGAFLSWEHRMGDRVVALWTRYRRKSSENERLSLEEGNVARDTPATRGRYGVYGQHSAMSRRCDAGQEKGTISQIPRTLSFPGSPCTKV